MASEPERPQLGQRIERARRVVSHCSQAAIRAYDEEALLSEACRSLIDVGGYCLAWFGEAKPDHPNLIPLGHAGSAPSGVRSPQMPWTADTGKRSPTLRAIHEQRPHVIRGISTDPALQKRIPEAGPLGFAAVCAFPIQFGPHGVAALTIYAREPDAFAPEEVALLRELAGDMGVGVAALRAKQANDVLEEQLELAELRFRSLIEGAPVAILQIGLDGSLFVANQALAQLLGYSTPAEVVAQTPAELARHLDDADRARIERTVRSGPPYKPLELRVRRRDGGHVWVEVQAQPGNGNAQRTIEAFVHDLTPARAAQLASARLAAVVDSSEEAVIGIGTDGVVQSWSRGATALYGHGEAEAIGRPLVDLCVPEPRRLEWEGLLATLAQGQRVHRFETQRHSRAGDLRDVSVAAGPVLDSDGQVVGASLLEHDVGERKRAQTARVAQERQEQEVLRVQELNRMRSEFMEKASHELNTPLTPVLLQVQALRESQGLDARQAMGLAAIERNVIRLAVLVKDLLLASNLDASHLALKPTDVDLQHLAADAVESFQAQASKGGVLLSSRSAGPVPAFADGDRVMQVLFNLIGNALKFTPRKGTVTVQAANRDGAPTVTVCDTGLGFSEEGRASLFSPFGRLHENVPGAPAGTGLGLFISKGIIEKSGGAIWAESPGPGKGCTLGFTLPRRASKHDVPRPSRPSAGSPQRRSALVSSPSRQGHAQGRAAQEEAGRMLSR